MKNNFKKTSFTTINELNWMEFSSNIHYVWSGSFQHTKQQNKKITGETTIHFICRCNPCSTIILKANIKSLYIIKINNGSNHKINVKLLMLLLLGWQGQFLFPISVPFEDQKMDRDLFATVGTFVRYRNVSSNWNRKFKTFNFVFYQMYFSGNALLRITFIV